MAGGALEALLKIMDDEDDEYIPMFSFTTGRQVVDISIPVTKPCNAVFDISIPLKKPCNDTTNLWNELYTYG